MDDPLYLPQWPTAGIGTYVCIVKPVQRHDYYYIHIHTYILRKFQANHPNFAERANTSRLDQFVCHVEIIFKLFSLSLSKMVNLPFSPDVATRSLAFMLRDGGNGNSGPTSRVC